jgi:hypothetical protein
MLAQGEGAEAEVIVARAVPSDQYSYLVRLGLFTRPRGDIFAGRAREHSLLTSLVED